MFCKLIRMWIDVWSGGIFWFWVRVINFIIFVEVGVFFWMVILLVLLCIVNKLENFLRM